MYGTLTGAQPPQPAANRPATTEPATVTTEELAKVVKLPAQRKRAS